MITKESFQAWLEAYGRASIENNPRASADLFSEDAVYYETPFAKPMIGREAIYSYWQRGGHALTDKTARFEVLAIDDNRGLARWQAAFVQVASANRIALDCLFLVEFNEELTCQVFREWWHKQVIVPDGNSDPIDR